MGAARTQLLYISSRNRKRGAAADQPYDFHLQLEHGIIKLDKPGVITVTVLDVVMPRSWYNVNSNNDTFYLNDSEGWVTLSLNHGSYNVYQLRQEIERALKLLNGSWAVSFDKITNKYTFHPPAYDSITPWTLSFPATTHATHELFGFAQTEQPAGTGATPFTSTMPVKVNPESAVLIHANLPKVKYTVADNMHTVGGKALFTESDVLMKVPVTVAPFDTVVYTAQGADLVSFELSTHQVHDLHVWVTDEFNKPLMLQHDWTMTLKLDYEEGPAHPDAVHGLAQDVGTIKQWFQLLILMLTGDGQGKKSLGQA